MGKNRKKSVYIYAWLNRSAVHQKLTQHCISTTLQLKIFFYLKNKYLNNFYIDYMLK